MQSMGIGPFGPGDGLRAQRAHYAPIRNRLMKSKVKPAPKPKPEYRFLRPSWLLQRRKELMVERLVAASIWTAIACRNARKRMTPSKDKVFDVTVRVKDIQRAVCREYGITFAELIGPQRSLKFVYPRHLAMHLASKLSGQSLPAIGRLFGDRDHTTVLHARDSFKRRMESDPALAAASNRIEELLVVKSMGHGDGQI